MQTPQVPAPAVVSPPPELSAASVVAGPSARKIELVESWLSIKKRWLQIAALCVAFAALAWVIGGAMTPIYRASAKVMIEPGKTKMVTVEDFYRSNNLDSQFLTTQIEIIRSRENATRVVQSLNLMDRPEFNPKLADPSLTDRLKGWLGISTSNPALELSEADLMKRASGLVMRNLNAQVIRGSQLIVVTFDSPSPGVAARVANMAVQQYLESERGVRGQFTRRFNQQLEDQLIQLREKLDMSEAALEEFRNSRDVVGSSAAANRGENPMLQGMSTRLLEAREKRMALETAYVAAKTRPPSEWNAIPEIARDPAVADATKVLEGLAAKARDLELTSGAEFWKIEKARTEVADARTQLQRLQRAVISQLASQYEAVKEIEATYEKGLSGLRGEARKTGQDEFKLAILEREYQSNRQFYEAFLNRFKEADLAQEMEASVGRMIDPALPPGSSIKPNRPLIVVSSVLLAILLGCGAAILIDRMDDTIKGGEDAEHRLGMPLLAALPAVAAVEGQKMARLYLDDSVSHFAESIRTARTGVMLSNLDSTNKILLITSSLPGEGKTTVAINFSLAHAQTKKTLLIDCDMRRSQVARGLGMPSGLPGLSNLVAGTAQVVDCIHTIPGTDLQVLPVGDIPPNPLEMLLSQRFRDALQHLSTEYEMIVIDSPPVALVSDALVVAPLATSVAYVVSAMSTPAPLVRKSLDRIVRAGGRILGILVNKLDFTHARQYYGDYNGGYGYGEGGYGGYGAYGVYGKTPRKIADAGAGAGKTDKG